jgi:hypothetical protein
MRRCWFGGGSVCLCALGKGHFRALRARRRRNQPLSAPLGGPSTNISGEALAERGRPAYTRVGTGESKRKFRVNDDIKKLKG